MFFSVEGAATDTGPLLLRAPTRNGRRQLVHISQSYVTRECGGEGFVEFRGTLDAVVSSLQPIALYCVRLRSIRLYREARRLRNFALFTPTRSFRLNCDWLPAAHLCTQKFAHPTDRVVEIVRCCCPRSHRALDCWRWRQFSQ